METKTLKQEINLAHLSGMLFGLSQMIVHGADVGHVVESLEAAGIKKEELELVTIDEYDLFHLEPALKRMELFIPRFEEMLKEFKEVNELD